MKKNLQNTVLSTEPYKGTTDFLPQDLLVRNYIFNKWRQFLADYGYEEYETSTLESAEVYRIKSGEELGSNQLYHFEDKGGRQVALRPEQTPSLARMVANNFGSLRFPLRWFSIPNCYRYEKPQHGRSREFWQLNVDIIGKGEGWADLEILQIAVESVLSLGANRNDFVLYYNHRGILDIFLNEIGVTEDQKMGVYKILDNWTKQTKEANELNLSQILTDKPKNQILCLMEFTKKEMDLWYDIMDDEFPEFAKIFKHIEAVIGKKANVQFNPCVVRGLAYYTGLVFEIFDTDPSNSRALLGGGRYDDLLDIYGQKAMAVGFGAGHLTLTEFVKNHNLLPEKINDKPKIILVPTSDKALEKCWLELVDKYQKEGNRVEIDYDLERTLNKRLESATKRGGKGIEV